MSIFESIGLLAGLVQLIGYIWYISYVLRGEIKPNSGSWLIWSYGNAIVCWSYIYLDHLTIKEALPLVCSILSLVCTGIFFFKGLFEPLKKREWGILFIDILITFYWIITGETLVTQVLLQVSVFISFIPIISETREEPYSERKGPWMVWSVAYLLLLVAESPDGFWKYIYPANYFIWHVLMAYYSARSKPLIA